MTDTNHQPLPGDRLDRAAAAVRGQAIPAPPADLSAAVLAAVRHRTSAVEVASVARRRRRVWVMRGMTVGGLAACVAVALTWGGGRAVALDGMLQKVRAAESLVVRTTQTLGDQTETRMQWSLKGTKGRADIGSGSTVLVFDTAAGRGQMRVPALREYLDVPAGGPAGKTPVQHLLALRDASTEPLGREAVDGRPATKLRVRQPADPAAGDPAADWVLWLDPGTELPLRAVCESAGRAGDRPASVRTEFTGFVWNPKLDDALFDLSPPAGYAKVTRVGESRADRTRPVSLLVALDNQEKAKSFRAVIRTRFTDPLPGLPDVSEQRLFQQGEAARVEGGDTVTVGTPDQLVQFDHKAKVARVGKTADVRQPDRIKAAAAGVRKALAAGGDGTAERVPAVEVLGKKRPGFKVSGVDIGDDQTADITYYLDEERALPVRWEIAVAGPAGVVSTCEYLAFDEALDPKLFSQDIPAGYKREELKLRSPTEKTRTVSLSVALDNQGKAKSFRAVMRTTPANAPAGSKPTEQKIFGQGVKVRIEAGDVVTVADGEAGRLVLFDRKAKVARVGDEAFIKGAAGHPEVAEAVRKLLAKEGAEDLGETFLDGRKVHTYRVKGLKLGEQTLDVTYTVDAKRELPVRVEHAIVGGPLALTQTLDYLGFDEELDPKLFDQTVPADYTREELKLPAVETPGKPAPPKTVPAGKG